MSAQSKLREQIRDTLSRHATFEYTDAEENQIVCICGWESTVFLPGGLVNVYDVFSTHQLNTLINERLV